MTLRIWKTYLCWFCLVSLAFFIAYPLCNHWSAQQEHVFRFYIDAELGIPFIAQFIWAYLSMYVLFFLPPFFLEVPQLHRLGKRLILATLIAACIFLLFPAPAGFIREIPANPFYAKIFTRLFELDLPFNTLPSLHVMFSALILWAIADAKPAYRIPAFIWLTLICASTLFVHQHHIADIVSALILVFIMHRSAWIDKLPTRPAPLKRKPSC